MQITIFEISKMDCPSEANLIKLKFNDHSEIINLNFDIQNRKLIVYHKGGYQQIEKAIEELNFSSKFISSEECKQFIFEEQLNQ